MIVSAASPVHAGANITAGLWLAHVAQRFPLLVTLSKDGSRALKASDKLETENWREFFERQQILEENRLAALSSRLRKQYTSLDQQKKDRKLQVIDKPLIFKKRSSGMCTFALSNIFPLIRKCRNTEDIATEGQSLDGSVPATLQSANGEQIQNCPTSVSSNLFTFFICVQ